MRAEALELYCRSLSYFFASKKLKKRRASTMRIACRGSRIVLSIFIILFREQKAQKKKSLNYAYCVSRLSNCTVDLYHTFSRAKSSKKRRALTTRIACRGSRLVQRVHLYPNPSLIFQARRKLLFLNRLCN